MTADPTFVERLSLPLFLILTPMISLGIALFLPLPTVVITLLMILVPATLAILLTTQPPIQFTIPDPGKGLFDEQ